MIHDIDESLRALIRRDVARDGEVDVVFEAPTKDWAARRNAPTIDVYLYDIREDLRRRQYGVIDVQAADGSRNRVAARRQSARFFKLSYLLTAWTQRPEDEHRLLSALLGCFLRHDIIPIDVVAGDLAELGVPLEITLAIPPPEDRALSDVWSALGGELKPSLDLVVIAPLDLDRDAAPAPPVTTPPAITIGSPGIAPERAGGKRAARAPAAAASAEHQQPATTNRAKRSRR